MDQLAQIAARLEKVADRLEKCGGPVQEEQAPDAFDLFLTQYLDPIVAAAKTLPEKIQKMNQLFEQVYREEAKIIKQALQCQKPTPDELKNLAKPIDENIKALLKIAPFKNEDIYNYGKTLEEASKCANWILIAQTPMDYIDNTWQVGEVFCLKLIRETKTEKPEHAAWANAVKKFCVELLAFVKEYHRTGLTWNAKGKPLSQFVPSAAPAAAPAPAQAKAVETTTSTGPAAVDLSAALSVGTSGLKKVDPSEKTKNRPAEERKSTVPDDISAKRLEREAQAATKAAVKVSPPKFENVRGRLHVEHQVNNKELKFDSESPRQIIYLFNDKNSALQVSGKVNGVTIDKCINCQVVLDSVIANIEIINSRNVSIQITGNASSIVIESSEDVKMYLSEESKKSIEIFSAKSNGMIVYAPGIRVDPDTKEATEGQCEYPLPSTITSKFNDKGELDSGFVKHG
ncbi:putative Cyclase-associated protein [Blattamonas nauphoetae]|uniref:Cyclase-associated protein n=1 Tax=Blattamonas nauphoetae TaxID=2049346 RepID=A0ABQ9YHB6_9EUKA|nr:putative Cyclase-associated protein [Blattamonas nauphoetae]